MAKFNFTFDVVSNPVSKGRGGIDDFMRPNRVVVGAENRSLKNERTICPLHLIMIGLLEWIYVRQMTKYRNAYVAKNFIINEMANIY